MRHFIYTKVNFSLFSFVFLFLLFSINHAHPSNGGVNFHGSVVEDSAVARNKCRIDAIELGISQHCSASRGTIVRTTVVDSAMKTSANPDSGEVKIRRILMNYD